ncbi:MAG: 4Fe-4S binding protein [Nitrospirae bacterium]|nr:4Fe-4S binding protein [Nitrospirota bacterium]
MKYCPTRYVLRRLTQGIFFVLALLTPVFDIFRFDISAMELYLFGQLWSFAPKGEYMSGAGGDPANFIFRGLIPCIVLFASLPFWGAVLGRFLCGWFCPVGATLEIGDFISNHAAELKKSWLDWKHNHGFAAGKSIFYRVIESLFYMTALLTVSVFLSGLLMSPSRIWHEVSSLKLSPLFIMIVFGIMMLIVFTYILARRLFCSYICLIGLTQMLPAAASPISLRIRFDKKRASMCTNCRQCEKACFMGLKPRAQRRVDTKCVNCGKCITACELELGRENGLLSYGFGAGDRNDSKTTEGVVPSD